MYLFLSKVFHINVEIVNLDSTLLNIVNCNVDARNAVSMLIWRFPMSWRQTNLQAMLKQI